MEARRKDSIPDQMKPNHPVVHHTKEMRGNHISRCVLLHVSYTLSDGARYVCTEKDDDRPIDLACEPSVRSRS
jgi:hypothetical protein